MHRRGFLKYAAGLGLSGLGLTSGCKKPVTRESVLDALVRDVWVPELRSIREMSVRLNDAVARFAAAPAEQSLTAARDAWKTAIVAWRRGYAGRNGPLVESGALFRTAFWPVRGAVIDSQIDGDAPLDRAHLDELGVDLKGLYGLEYLLFGVEKAAGIPPRFTGPRAARASRLAAVFSDEVRRSAEDVVQIAGDGDGYAKKLAADAQHGVTLLVAQAAGATESLARRVQNITELARNRRLGAREIEGWPSSASTAVLGALALGTEHVYSGAGAGGLGALVHAVAPDVDRAVTERAQELRAALDALGGPVEDAGLARPETVARVATAAKAFEIALKADVSSALGVTLTWSAGDGD